jgi:hypothetical protein
MHAKGNRQGKSYDPRPSLDDAYTVSEHPTSIVLRPAGVHGYRSAVRPIGSQAKLC